MTAKELVTSHSTKDEINRRRRRHWYDHEKLSIIQAYDRQELSPDPKKTNNVIDPKSKESLPVFLIEGWRDAFRTLGLIKSPKPETPKPISATPSSDSDAMQTLLVNTILENQKLKELVTNLKRNVVTRKRSDNGKDANV